MNTYDEEMARMRKTRDENDALVRENRILKAELAEAKAIKEQMESIRAELKKALEDVEMESSCRRTLYLLSEAEIERLRALITRDDEVGKENAKLVARVAELEAMLSREQRADSVQNARRSAKNSSFSNIISGAWTAAGLGRAIVRGKVLADPGVDLESVHVALSTSDGRRTSLRVQRNGSFEGAFDGEGGATLHALDVVGVPWKEIPVHLIRGGVSLPVIDLRTCTNASCEDVPAMRMLVPTAEVRVFYQNRRILQVSRRCAMRALKTGEGLSGYWRPTRFETREGRTLAASDIDWTGFGLKPIIHHSRVLVQRSDVFLKWANLGPLERARVLDVFRRDGVLPEGYRFSPGYPDLLPNDVNWEMK